MIPFSMLSAFVRAIFALWALLLCLINITSGVLLAVRKRYTSTAVAFLLFVPVFFMWQLIFDLSLFKLGKASLISEKICNIPWAFWIIAFAFLSVGALVLLLYNVRYDKTFITPGTIKTYLDKMPCGICCWRKNGRVLFSNNCMNELCAKITGKALLNGNHFKDAVEGGIITVENSVWRFALREITMDGEQLYEMVASDITAEYAKTRALEKDKAELSRLNEELREYYSSIDESVKHREILQAKMNIHDEMNRLMLSTVAADLNNPTALDETFSLWEQNALLLCMEADKKNNNQQKDAIISLSKALGISLLWNENIISALGEKEKELFYFTAQEAMINAVKHAGAKELRITLEEGENELLFRFCNNGIMPEKEVNFEGGLANISLLCKKQGADLFVEKGNEFTLVLRILKND